MTRLVTFLFLFFALPSLLFAEAYDNKVIERIDVIFEKEPADTLYCAKSVLGKLRTRIGDLFSQTAFDNDLKDLAADYDHVEPMVEVIDTNLYITLKVWPKPRIRQIFWEGVEKIAPCTLEGELGLKCGILFDRVEFNRAFQKVKAYYVKQGFFEADLDYTIAIDPCCNEIDITIHVCEGRSGRIGEIKLCGFTPCEECDILEMMYTKTYNWFLSWISNDGTYNEEMIQVDQFRILNYLHDHGYPDAQVDIDICESDKCNRIVIVITATKGACYHIGPITFQGNCIFSDEAVAGAICLREGDVYSPDAIRNTITGLTSLYGRYGYIDAVIDYEVRLIEGENAYSLKITIEEGDQFRVGLIKIFGNYLTESRVILHECLIIPGEIFNSEKLKKSEARLTNIGFFKCVNVYVAQPNDQLGCECRYRDVHIEVEETGTGHFGAFAGYSTAESLFCGISITEKNFRYRGLFDCWDDGWCKLRGGGEYLSLQGNIGQRASSYGLSWTQPFFRDTQWTIGFDINRSWSQLQSENYSIWTTGGAFHATHPLDAFTRFGWHYRLCNSTVEIEEEGTINPELAATARQPGLISATGISLNYDSTDSPSCPTNGFRSRVELEFAGIGGDSHFWAFAYLNTYYYELHKKGVLKFRGDLRFVMPTRTPHGAGVFAVNFVPLEERLFLGGDNQVRGYRPYALGPHFDNTNTPSGGLSLVLLSAEYNRKLYDRLDAFLFFDGGELSQDPKHFSRLNCSAGFGVRIRVFDSMPPVQVGMGFPINPRSRSDVQRFFWALGGRF